MSQITIDTQQIKNMLLYILAAIGFAALIGVCVWAAFHSAVPTATTPQPIVVTPVVTPSYPTVLTFTVLSTTTSNNHYSIYTTTGQTLYCANYDDWNRLYPRGVYVSDVIGLDGTAYLIQNPVLISRPYAPESYLTDYNSGSYPVYYAWNDRYYQYDGYRVDEVSWKQVRDERLIYSMPPYGYRR